MRRATENQGNTRALSEYFVPRSKVKNLTPQQCTVSHFTSFRQETPMQPSQVPNRLSHPPPRRMLPLHYPEPGCDKDRPGPTHYSPSTPDPIDSIGYVPSCPTYTGTPVNRTRSIPRDRHGHLQHFSPPLRSPGSSTFLPVSPTSSSVAAHRRQTWHCSMPNPESTQLLKDFSPYSPSTCIRTDQPKDSKAAECHSGSKHAMAQRQDPKEAQSSSVRRCIPTVTLHRPPTLPDLNNHNKQQKERPASEKFNPAAVSNNLSQKRPMQFEDWKTGAKKLCIDGAHSSKAQLPKPIAVNSLTSPVSQPSSQCSSVVKLSPTTTNSHLCTERASGQSTGNQPSSTFKPNQLLCVSLSPTIILKRLPAMGAKQAYINTTQGHTVKLTDIKSPSKPSEKLNERKCSLPGVSLKDAVNSPHSHLGNNHSGHTHKSTPVKTLSRVYQVEETRKSESSPPKLAAKPSSASASCPTVERTKAARSRKPVSIPDDISDLFTPDPMTYLVSPVHKNALPKVDGGTIRFPTSEKNGPSTPVTSSVSSVTGTSCHKSPNVTVTSPAHTVGKNVSSFSTTLHQQTPIPSVTLQRVKLENLKPPPPKDRDPKQTPVPCSNLRPWTLETDAAASEQSSRSHCPWSPLQQRRPSEGGRKHVNEEDLIDVELDLDLSLALDVDLTQTSNSSDEEEQLLSLQEIMERAAKPPDTPERGTFSLPSTPGHSCLPKTQPLPPTTKSGTYKNNLDQMLKEIKNTKKSKENETEMLTACEENKLKIAEYEEAEENHEEAISTEEQEILQRYTLMSNAMKEVPPGEEVFILEKFGKIFNYDTLQLRQCMANPQGTHQKTLLWSSPAQLRLHLNSGLFQEAYCRSPCPTQVTRFLFKMMSVHGERMVSEKILQALCDISCSAAYQIVKNGNQQFKVWSPSLPDVALVLMNMGVAFVTLFPFGNLQPPFTEGDLLEDVSIKSESPSSNKEQSYFPEHNCNNIFKYLSHTMGLCPHAYSEEELLLLLTMVGRLALDTHLILQCSVDLYPLLYKTVNNFRDWDTMLPRICRALTDLTDDHHNMCFLVQLLPDNTRGKRLRRHLSLSMISKLLDGSCTYRPTEKEIQLSKLRLYLPRMRPSSLLQGMVSSNRSQKDKEDKNTLDQQSYYLCYSLLKLANEASNFQFFPAQQKKDLLFLCSELETHVKCDIRESEKCLYRSKVKDLVARMYTRWQKLLQRTRPLNDKLYDYWQPMFEDSLTSGQEEQETNNNDDDDDDDDDEDGSVMEDDEGEETSGTEENEVVDEEMGEVDDAVDDPNQRGGDTLPEKSEGDDTVDYANEKEDATESVHGVTESKVMDENIEAANMETEVEPETMVET